MVVYVYNPSSEEVAKAELWSLLLIQHGLFGKFQASESPCIKNQSTNKTQTSKQWEIDGASVVDLPSWVGKETICSCSPL